MAFSVGSLYLIFAVLQHVIGSELSSSTCRTPTVLVDVDKETDTRAYIHPGINFKCQMWVRGWSYYAKSTESVVAAIWRPTVADDFQLVGKHLLTPSKKGENEQTFEPNEWIKVEAGDVVGIHYPQNTSSFVIPQFESCDNETKSNPGKAKGKGSVPECSSNPGKGKGLDSTVPEGLSSDDLDNETRVLDLKDYELPVGHTAAGSAVEGTVTKAIKSLVTGNLTDYSWSVKVQQETEGSTADVKLTVTCNETADINDVICFLQYGDGVSETIGPVTLPHTTSHTYDLSADSEFDIDVNCTDGKSISNIFSFHAILSMPAPETYPPSTQPPTTDTRFSIAKTSENTINANKQETTLPTKITSTAMAKDNKAKASAAVATTATAAVTAITAAATTEDNKPMASTAAATAATAAATTITAAVTTEDTKAKASTAAATAATVAATASNKGTTSSTTTTTTTTAPNKIPVKISEKIQHILSAIPTRENPAFEVSVGTLNDLQEKITSVLSGIDDISQLIQVATKILDFLMINLVGPAETLDPTSQEMIGDVLDYVIRAVGEAVDEVQPPDQPYVSYVTTMSLQLLYARLDVTQNQTMSLGNQAAVNIPALLLQESEGTLRRVQVRFSEQNLQGWGGNAEKIGASSAFTSLEIFKDNKSDIVSTHRRKRSVPQQQLDGAVTYELSPKNHQIKESPTFWFVNKTRMSFQVKNKAGFLHISVDKKESSPVAKFRVLVSSVGDLGDLYNNTLPRNTFDGHQLPQELWYTVIIPLSQLTSDLNYFVSVEPLEEISDSFDGAINFMMSFVELSCFIWDGVYKYWHTDENTCEVSVTSKSDKVTFKSDILGSFGVGLYIPPNKIDFDTVFNDLDTKVKDSAYVLGFIAGLLALYLALLLPMFCLDRRDKRKWMFHWLTDDQGADQFKYRISVYTTSSTEASCFFILAGEDGQTEARQLTHGNRQGFASGSVENFVFSCPYSLGPLIYLHVWHDNSPQPSLAAWFLNKISIYDESQGESYTFPCGRWMSRHHEDGRIDRLLVPTGSRELERLGFSAGPSTASTLADEHLWLSVAYTIRVSRFTRVQRLSVLLSFTFMCMLTNAMWFETGSAGQSAFSLKIGFVEVTIRELFVSCMTCIIVLPVNLLLIYVFRHACSHAKASNQRLCYQKIKTDPLPVKRGFCFELPYWTRHVAWVTLWLTVLVSGFLTILYSFQWTKDKNTSWLSAMLLTIFEDAFIIGPVKVMAVFIFVNLCSTMKRNKEDTGLEEEQDEMVEEIDLQEIEDKPQGGLSQKGLIYVKQAQKKFDGLTWNLASSLAHRPPTNTYRALVLERQGRANQKQKRKQELKNATYLRSVASHAAFICLVGYLIQVVHDPMTFWQNREIENVFLGDLKRHQKGMAEQPLPTFWSFLQKDVIDSLYATHDYNYKPLPRSDRLHISNLHGIRMGPARIRQLRADGKCYPPWDIRQLGVICNGKHDSKHKSKVKDNIKWGSKPKNLHPSMQRKFQSAFLISPSNGNLLHGSYGKYSTGGYIMSLPESPALARHLLAELEDAEWLDGSTRAVILEFTIFNMDMDLFTIAQILFEFPSIGGTHVKPDIQSVRLYDFSGARGVLTLLAEVVFILVTLYRTFDLVVICSKKSMSHVVRLGQLAGLVSLGLAYTSMILYGLRTVHTIHKVEELKNTGGYVSFHHVLLLGQGFVLSFGMVVFLSILHLLRLLSFNRHMWMVGFTLARSKTFLITFGAMLLVTLFSFTQLGVNMFVTGCSVFKHHWETLMYLVGMLVGKFSLTNLEIAPMWQSFVKMYFISFHILVLMGLTGWAISQLHENIVKAQRDLYSRKNEADVVEYMLDKILSLIPRGDVINRNRFASIAPIPLSEILHPEDVHLT